ncbi:MAG: prenyltransferase [Planctomycetota bacterium]
MRIVLVWLVVAALGAEEAPQARLEAAVDRGLAALARIQRPDGSVDQGTRITSLAGMAFLSGGHTPTRGAYKEASARCLDHVLDNQDALTGFLGSNNHAGMYEHGFATLYLAEVHGMSNDRRVRSALEAALDLIYRSQNEAGGWRYYPTPVDADISVTICQIMAIRAAYNIGIGGTKSQRVMAAAVDYVRSCANADGSFDYQASSSSGWGTKGARGVPRSAAGSMCLIGAGAASGLEDRHLGPALGFLRDNFAEHLEAQSNWFWYGQYYCAQAMFHSPQEEDWATYWQAAWPTIVELQKADGLWLGPDSSYGAGFNTAMALIILQIPNNYLPIFQR